MPRAKYTVNRNSQSVASRYGIAEWYGRDITQLDSREIKQLASLALSPHVDVVCPFYASIESSAKCNKQGGVCTIRLYSRDEFVTTKSIEINRVTESIEVYSAKTVYDEKTVTVCPRRFLQEQTIFKWVGQTILDCTDPIVVPETPFLKNAAESSSAADQRKAGRIDWILVDPKSIDSQELKWCALETQSVYFSGMAMTPEFQAYQTTDTQLIYPVAHRRPDYRSNGPKRLAPQLSIKVPVIRSFGAKVAVVVDAFFFGKMGKVADVFPSSKSNAAKLKAADIVWFVVDYSQRDGLVRIEDKVAYSSLLASVEALNASEPIDYPDFSSALRQNAREVFENRSR